MAVDAGPADSPMSQPGDASIEPDGAPVVDYDADVVADDDDAVGAVADEKSSSLRTAALSGFLIVVALAGLVTFLGVRSYQAHRENDHRNALLELGRQTALNLTTIDWQHADEDVQRILASATGTFFDDFAQRSKPFVDVVKQSQSTSVGTVTESGLESYSGDAAKMLVTVSVKTTDRTAAQTDPRNWRMRMTIEKVDDEEKVSDVEFVQ